MCYQVLPQNAFKSDEDLVCCFFQGHRSTDTRKYTNNDTDWFVSLHFIRINFIYFRNILIVQLQAKFGTHMMSILRFVSEHKFQ